MICSQCGSETSLQEGKFCSYCGFELSGVENPKPVDLKKFIDTASDASRPGQSARAEKDDARPLVHEESLDAAQNKKAKTRWWKSLDPPQIVILVLSGLFILVTIAMLNISSGGGGIDAALLTTLILVGTLFVLVWKEKPWGWGWCILLGMTGSGVQSTYKEYGIYNNVLALWAVLVSLAIYFALRNNYFTKIQEKWKRSLYSGLIAFVMAAFLTPLFARLFPTLDHRIAEVILEENSAFSATANPLKEKSERLWKMYIQEPSRREEFEANSLIVEELRPVYRQRDSVCEATFQHLYARINKIHDETAASDWSLPIRPSDFLGMVEKTQELAKCNQQVLANLSAYNRSVLVSDGRSDYLWQAYGSAQEKQSLAIQEYSQAYARIFNPDTPKR